MMIGVDISNWQKGLTMAEIRGKGADFVIIRATRGADHADLSGPGFYMAARAAGIPMGVYNYSEATTPEEAEAEARFLLSKIGGWPMPCGVWMDVETPEQLSMPDAVLLETVRAWCAVIRAAGYVPGVYSSELSAWSKINPDELGDDVLVWVARYGAQPNMACDLWQYTDQENTSLNFKLDVDVVRSDRFRHMVEAAKPAPPAEEEQQGEDHAADADETAPDISGALGLLAAYLQTPQFKENFLKFIEEGSK